MRLPQFPQRRFIPTPPLEELLETPTPTGSTVSYVIDNPDPDIAARPRVSITAMGSDNPQIAKTISATSAIAYQDGQFPVVVASDLTTEFLVNAPMPTELLPRRRDLHVLSNQEYAQYVNDRWTIILGKWAITERIDLAMDITGFIAAELA